MSKSILVAVSSSGTLKNYIEDKWVEMAKACIEPINGVNITVYGDRDIGAFNFREVYTPDTRWADEIIYRTHQCALEDAKKYGYDAVIFQGLDTLYNSREDFERLISHKEDIVGAITVGRKQPDYPVVRFWERVAVIGGDNPGYHLISNQLDVPKEGLLNERMAKCGYPGTEAMIINNPEAFKIPIANSKYKMWYKYPEWTVPRPLVVHEFWCWQAAKKGFGIFCDTETRTWHVDDDGMAHRWQSESKHMNELSW